MECLWLFRILGGTSLTSRSQDFPRAALEQSVTLDVAATYIQQLPARQQQLEAGMPRWGRLINAAQRRQRLVLYTKTTRPPRDPAVTIRLPEAVLASVERGAMSQKEQPPRSKAIRRLVEIGLPAAGNRSSRRSNEEEMIGRLDEFGRKVKAK